MTISVAKTEVPERMEQSIFTQYILTEICDLLYPVAQSKLLYCQCSCYNSTICIHKVEVILEMYDIKNNPFHCSIVFQQQNYFFKLATCENHICIISITMGSSHIHWPTMQSALGIRNNIGICTSA